MEILQCSCFVTLQQPERKHFKKIIVHESTLLGKDIIILFLYRYRLTIRADKLFDLGYFRSKGLAHDRSSDANCPRNIRPEFQVLDNAEDLGVIFMKPVITQLVLGIKKDEHANCEA